MLRTHGGGVTPIRLQEYIFSRSTREVEEAIPGVPSTSYTKAGIGRVADESSCEQGGCIRSMRVHVLVLPTWMLEENGGPSVEVCVTVSSITWHQRARHLSFRTDLQTDLQTAF